MREFAPNLGADPLWGPSAEVVQVQENGWIGITDHYWMTTLIPEPGTPFTAVKRYFASEDTYRTLTAVDSALMVIDCAKGVELRTIKLMEVCRLRDTAIMTFINKLDREGREPI